MRCSECNYFWKDEGDEYGRCHFDADGFYSTPWDKAPCEYEDEEPEHEYDEERW